jgi:hypothetical protein
MRNRKKRTLTKAELSALGAIPGLVAREDSPEWWRAA